MNPKMILVAATLLTASDFVLGQGKVNVVNDGASLIGCGTHAAGTNLMVGLYGGTSSSSLFLYSAVSLSSSAQPDGAISFHVVLTAQPNGAPAIPGIVPGTPIGASTPWFQVRVWDSAYPTYETAHAAGAVSGQGAEFQLNPGPSLLYQNTAPPGANSTWQEAPIDVCPCMGPYLFFDLQPISRTVVQGSNVTFSARAAACPPGHYQWRFNGVDIQGATSNNWLIAKVKPSDAGLYSVVVSNFWAYPVGVWHSITSLDATLTVLVPPTITTTPPSQTVEMGAIAGFAVEATGSAPLRFQWFFEGDPLVEATNSSLALIGVQTGSAGAYSVSVTNAAGAITSPPARLGVIPAVSRQMVPGLLFAGQPGTIFRLKSGEDLTLNSYFWPFQDSVMLTNSTQWYFDLTTPLAARRFYQAWQTNSAGTLSSWNLNLIPALTLTGAIGDSVRVDCINQVGPVDAWVNLATVALTNTSQLYFDSSVIGQPPRLWRVVPVP